MSKMDDVGGDTGDSVDQESVEGDTRTSRIFYGGNPASKRKRTGKGKMKVDNQFVGASSEPDSETPKDTTAKKRRFPSSKVLTVITDGNGGSSNEHPMDVTGLASEKDNEVGDVTDKANEQSTDKPNTAGGNSKPVFLGLHTRTTPASFCRTLSKLNTAQKEAVISMGFGGLLEMRVSFLPNQLAYWLLDNFDHKTRELVIDDNVKIKVTEDDVHRVFGFPRGSEVINRFLYSSCTALSLQWVRSFNVMNRDNIKIKAVLEKMLMETDGGPWFKRQFLIAVQFTLIESYPSGTVHPFVMKCLEDLDVVKNWNWGRYVLNALVHHAENWSKNRKKILCGPILLLVFLYVDRMTMKGMRVPRSIPICVNWPSNELMQHQKLETDKRFFGSGSLRGPIPLPTSEDFAPENVSGDIAVGVGESPERLLQARMIKISREIGEKSRFLKSVMLEASDEHRSSDVFKECVVKCSRISGLPLDEIYSGSTQADVIPPSTERQYDTGGRLETENVDIPVEEAVRDEVDIPVEEAVRDEVDIPVEEAVEQVDMPVDKEATVSEGLSNDVVLTDDLEAGLTCSAMPDKNVENENLTIEGDERDKLIGEYVTEEIHTKSSPKLCVTEQEVGNKSAVESESSYQVSTVDKVRGKSISKVQKVKIPPKIRQSQRVRKSSNDVNEGGAKEQETNPKLVKYKFTRRGRK